MIKTNFFKRILFSLLLVISSSFIAFSFDIPFERQIDWRGHVGVQGGIPSRTTIYRTITAGSGDRTSEIQNALDNCPAGQVVLLGPGTFNVTTLNMPSNVTLRGSGIDATVLKGISSNVNYIIGFGRSGSLGSSVNLNGGHIKGATTITTTTNHGWNVGDIIMIDQLASPDGSPRITSQGSQTFCTWCSRANGTRPIGQVVKVIAPTSGNTATLEIPLYWNVDGTKVPQGTKLNIGVRNSGVESLKIDNRDSWSASQASYGIVDIKYAENCWLDNVDLHGVWTNGIRLQQFYRITVSSSVIHLSHAYTSSAGYAMSLGFGGSASLFENNIFHDLSNGPQFEGSASGNVFAYNYATDMKSTQYPTAVRSGLGYHGSHAFMNLFEGNMFDGCYISADTYFGTNSWGTIFRNRVSYSTSKTDQRLDIFLGEGITYFICCKQKMEKVAKQKSIKLQLENP